MVNMKMSKKEVKNMMPEKVEQPKYPYGLCLELDGESLEKLGIKELPDVGDKMMVVAKVEVKSVSQSEYQKGEENKHVSLQITDMELAKPKMKDIEKKLYA